jgi:ribosomal protein S18 acetylase RimI-like enzyme
MGGSCKFHITALERRSPTVSELASTLIEVVANGGSVGFMHPLLPDAAMAFWEASLTAAAEGRRIVLGARDGDALIGTVTLLLDCPPNQPHRAEVAKLMTRVSHRGRGAARALLLAAERLAIDRGRTLLTLDTATEGGAGGLYEQLGFRKAGEIPDYALKPHGGLTGTILYWKRIGELSGLR